MEAIDQRGERSPLRRVCGEPSPKTAATSLLQRSTSAAPLRRRLRRRHHPLPGRSPRRRQSLRVSRPGGPERVIEVASRAIRISPSSVAAAGRSRFPIVGRLWSVSVERFNLVENPQPAGPCGAELVAQPAADVLATGRPASKSARVTMTHDRRADFHCGVIAPRSRSASPRLLNFAEHRAGRASNPPRSPARSLRAAARVHSASDARMAWSSVTPATRRTSRPTGLAERRQ